MSEKTMAVFFLCTISAMLARTDSPVWALVDIVVIAYWSRRLVALREAEGREGT